VTGTSSGRAASEGASARSQRAPLGLRQSPNGIPQKLCFFENPTSTSRLKSDIRDISRLKRKDFFFGNLRFWGKNSVAKKSDLSRLKSSCVKKIDIIRLKWTLGGSQICVEQI